MKCYSRNFTLAFEKVWFMALLTSASSLFSSRNKEWRILYRVIVFCLLVAGGMVYPAPKLLAQSDSATATNQYHHFSLNDCLQYAVQHQHDVVNARLDRQYSQEQVRENTGKLLPHVSINGSVVDNLKLATTLYPDIFNGDPDHKVPVQFGNKFTSDITGEVDQTVFNSNYFIGLKAAKVYEELSQRSLSRTEIDTRVNVTKAYYNVLVNKESIRLAKANLAQLEKSLQDTKAKYGAGISETVDVNRIQVQYNNAQTSLDNQQRLLQYSLAELKFQMGMPLADSLALSETVKDFAPGSAAAADTMNYSYQDRPEYAMQNIQVDLNKLSLKSTRLGFLPSLSAYVNYGYNYYSSRFSDLYRRGFGNSALGLSLSFPIFSGTERIHQTNEARITLQQSQNDLDNLVQQIQLDVKNAYTQYVNNHDQLQTQEKNMELTQGVYDRIKYKFDQGVSSSLDLLSAENELQQAQSQYINALLNALISQVDLDKAMGKIQTTVR